MTPTDPLYASQWYLSLLGTLDGARLIERIWDDYSGAGVHVGIYDSGVQYTHYELDGQYDASRSVITGGVVRDGASSNSEDANTKPHGTAVAGIIAAENDGIGTVGIAWGASLTSVNIFNPTGGAYVNSGNLSNFLSAVHQSTNFDVTNNSWGATPGFDPSQDLAIANSFSALTAAQYAYVAVNGRDGLGTIICQAAGNNNLDANGDGLNATRFDITVGALRPDGFDASYSNYGACLLISAAGADSGTAGIVTTDMLGTDGYNLSSNPAAASDSTDRFAGTSAATPVVTGVIALMLDANPDLGWRDVQDILALSANHTGSAINASVPGSPFENNTWFYNDAADWNGGGLHYSEDYGYGAIDAFAAVRMAEVWTDIAPAQTSANEVTKSTGTLTVNAPITSLLNVSVGLNLTGNVLMEHADLTLKITDNDFTDLRIFLDSPDGTEAQLYDGRSGSNATSDNGLTWTFGIDAFHGELSSGAWTVRIVDTDVTNIGTLNTIALNVYGSAPTSNDVYHYTDEFAASAAGDSARATLTDSNGGTDTIEAVAVTSNSTIDLTAGAVSTIAGQSLTIATSTTIENAFTGDGNDTITGNSAANYLDAGRGDDTLIGGAGNDTIDGGTGNDTMVLSGDHSSYAINFDTTGADFTVADQRAGTPDGVDTVTQVEVFQFTDGQSTYNSSTGTITSQTVDDITDAAPWASQVSSFDTLGALVTQTVAEDNGTQWTNTFDTLNTSINAPGVVSQTTSYDPSGQVATQTGTNDDGTHFLTLNDVPNAYGWSTAIIQFDANWNQISVTGTNDDGSHTMAAGEIEAALDTVTWFPTPFDPNWNTPAPLVHNVASDFDML